MRCEPALERRGIEFLTSAAAYATERTERAAACDIFVFELTLRLSWRQLERCRRS